MRRSELLITASRRATENLTFTETTGISDEEFLRYLNDGQERILRAAVKAFPNLIQNITTISVNANTVSVPKPAKGYFGSRIDQVEWSYNGQERSFFKLKKGNLSERFYGEASYPAYYIPIGDEIFLNPKPSTNGSLRVTYQKKPPTLDKRRGIVSAVTLGTDTITSLTLDSTLLTSEDITIMQNEEYVSIVDKDGAIKMAGIPITGISSLTGVVSVGTFTFEAGETIAVGDYIVSGKYATTHCELPDACEPYLIAHMDWKVLKRDSSNDSQEQGAELESMLQEIVDVFKQNDSDTNLIPVISTEFMGGDYWA